MKNIILFILSVLPSSIILKVIYDKDKNKESKKLLLFLFALGIFACFFTYAVDIFFDAISKSYHYLTRSGPFIKIYLYSFIKIALLEELSKWILNFSLIWKNKEFDEKYDSIVFSCFTSMGFATFENSLYVIAGGFKTAFLRSLISVPAHAIFSIISGYYLGDAREKYIKKEKKKGIFYIIISLIIPIVLHATYDFFILIHTKNSMIMFIVFVILLYINAINKVFDRIKETTQ